MHDEPIHITLPGAGRDPRAADPLVALGGVVVHRVRELHPDDVTIVEGIAVTSVARTLVDLAQDTSIGELRAIFRNADERGLLDVAAVRAAAARAQWHPGLAMLHELIDEFAR